MQASFTRYRLLFKQPFHTAHGTRDGTDSVILRLTDQGHQGYGESTIPPYRSDSIDDVLKIWSTVQWQHLDLGHMPGAILELTERVGEDHPEAAAGISMALYDLVSKHYNKSIPTLLNVPKTSTKVSTIPTMFTLAVANAQEIPERLLNAPACDAIKLKLDGRNDASKVASLIDHWKGPIFLDVNQGWKSRSDALGILKVLGSTKVLGLEQPFSKTDIDLHRWLKGTTDIPVYADEAASSASDISKIDNAYDGVNVKLMKCGGLDQAWHMIKEARSAGMKVMLGCMSEGSCGTSAAMQLAPHVDLLDQDGPLLIANDPFHLNNAAAGLGIECTIDPSAFLWIDR